MIDPAPADSACHLTPVPGATVAQHGTAVLPDGPRQAAASLGVALWPWRAPAPGPSLVVSAAWFDRWAAGPL